MTFVLACGNESVEATPTPQPPASTNTLTPTQTEESRTVVPGVTREATGTASPVPQPPDPPTANNVSITDAFPGLPGISRPIRMVEVPGQQLMLVVSQDGQVFSFPKDAAAAELTPVLDWRAQTSRDGNEEGLLGLALSPEFEMNGEVYLYYSASQGARRSVVSRFATTGTAAELRIDPASEQVLLEVAQPFSNHNGGHLEFGPDGFLYIGLGDGGSGGDPQGHGQNLSTLLGSMLRIDVASDGGYTIPADNPFVGVADAPPEAWAYGLRNPWRFSFDRETGELWAGDVGQSAWEEINILRAGGNYGWATMEGFECYGAASCDQSGLEMPVVAYGHAGNGCSVTGGYVARAEDMGVLIGYYVYGDFCSGRLWALRAADAESGAEPVMLQSEGPNISSFAEDQDGQLYMLAFDGRIYRVDG